jgi:hypothetical protein
LSGVGLGGQQSRLSLARTLLRSAVLICDEPAGLDPAAAKRWPTRPASPGSASSSSSPDLERLDAYDHIVFLEEGRKIAEGRHQDLSATPLPRDRAHQRRSPGLNDRLESAVHEVEQVVPDLQEIVRVDADAGELTLTAVGAGGTRWFTHDDRGLIERFPERDDRLPLAARLRASSDWRVLSYLRRLWSRRRTRRERAQGPGAALGPRRGLSSPDAARHGAFASRACW